MPHRTSTHSHFLLLRLHQLPSTQYSLQHFRSTEAQVLSPTGSLHWLWSNISSVTEKKKKRCQNAAERRATQRDEVIEQLLEEDRKLRRRNLKVLVLGSGKSTFIKTALLTRSGGSEEAFSEGYRQALRPKVFTSIIDLMQSIIRHLDSRDAFLEDGLLKPHILVVLAATTPYERETLDPELSSALEKLWQEDLIKENGYQMVEDESLVIESAAKHYLSDLPRISSNDYVPSDEDIVQLHIPTNGIEETVVVLGNNPLLTLRLFEVGHMISERRKWLHYTDDVTATMFVVPCSMYDYGSSPGDNTASNPLRTALQDFVAFVESQRKWENQRIWQKTKMILLMFNGMDKFKEKIMLKPLKDSFPEYEGEETFADSARFIHDLFLDAVGDGRQHVYAHFTASVDQANIRLIMGSLIDIIHPICLPNPMVCF